MYYIKKLFRGYPIMDEKKITLENGKLVITDETVITQITDQGLEFNVDGSLKVEEGANIEVTVKWP